MDDEVTLNCPNHHQSLVFGLWSYFLSCRGVDFDVQSCDGRSIRAHHLILDMFLSPEKLYRSAQHLHQQHGGSGSIECLLEFLYNGEVTVRREQLGILLKVARESDFQMLVDVLESRVPTDQKFVEQNEDFLGPTPNESLIESGNGFESPHSGHEPGGWSARTVKSELDDVADTGSEGEVYPADVNEEQTDDLLNSIRNPAAIDDEQDHETVYAGRLCSTVFQDDVTSSFTNEEFDENIYKRLNREPQDVPLMTSSSQGPLPETHESRDHYIPSMAPRRANAFQQGVPPTTSSSSFGSPSSEESSERFDFQVRKIKVEPDCEANVSDTKLLACDVCGKQFPSKFKLEAHVRIHTSELPYACDVCKKAFAKQGNLKRHLISHPEELPFPCQHCLLRFAERKALTDHELTHGDQHAFPCSEAGCGDTFARRHDLAKHQKTQHPIQPTIHQCHHCQRVFRFRRELAKHVQTHDGAELECQVCYQTFSRVRDLKFHERLHSGKPLVKCQICGMEFLNGSTLKDHMCSHGVGTKFPCDTCSKVFYKRQHLNEHRRIHTGDKPFQCPQCPKAFSQKPHLTVHLRSHTGERPYRCDHEGCGRTYQNSGNLRKHKLSHAGVKAFKCSHPNCSMAYYTLGLLNVHRLCHRQERTFICEHCGKSYKTINHLNRHVGLSHAASRKERHKCDIVTSHKEQPFICEHCGKAYKLRKHLNRHVRQTHAKERHECDIVTAIKEHHECAICGEIFDDLVTLNLHSDTHV